MPAVRNVMALVALGVLSLLGCGSDAEPEPNSAAPSAPATVPTTSGRALHYSSFGTEADIDCGDGRALNVAGSNNTLTVTGSCDAVSVTGADNRVRLDKVTDTLEVGGLNNTVVYLDGEPDVVNSGTGNNIRRD